MSSDGDSVPALEAARAFSDPNGDPLTYAASGLPTGLAIDPATGRITGTIAADAAPGRYAVTVLATDDKGAATPETFTWQVNDTPPSVSGGIPRRRGGRRAGRSRHRDERRLQQPPTACR